MAVKPAAVIRLSLALYFHLPCFIFIGMPHTIIITSSAQDAAYWFIHPSMSVNLRCTALSLVPPLPISLVTKMNVASCDINLSNSFFISLRALFVSGWLYESLLLSKKKFVHHKVMQSITATLSYISCLLRYFSSSMFSHCGPLRSLCFLTLSLNSSSHIWAVAMYTGFSVRLSASSSAYVLLPERCPPVIRIILLILV